ncbi:MAG: universal stress protein [Planctomycetes bacterium]|nr:universal stress protein [Planctomycetota bacterium]
MISGSNIGETVAEYANENDVDLITMSTHGRTGFRRLVLGSVAESILHYAHVPVLCFPQPE